MFGWNGWWLFGYTIPGFLSLFSFWGNFRRVLCGGGWVVLFPARVGIVYAGFWGRQSRGRHQCEPRCWAPCGGGGGWDDLYGCRGFTDVVCCGFGIKNFWGIYGFGGFGYSPWVDRGVRTFHHVSVMLRDFISCPTCFVHEELAVDWFGTEASHLCQNGRSFLHVFG